MSATVLQTHGSTRFEDDASQTAPSKNLSHQSATVVTHVVVTGTEGVGVRLAVRISYEEVATRVVEVVIVREDDPTIDTKSFAREAVSRSLKRVGTDPRFGRAWSQSLSAPVLVVKGEVRGRVGHLGYPASGMQGRRHASGVVRRGESHDVDSQ